MEDLATLQVLRAVRLRLRAADRVISAADGAQREVAPGILENLVLWRDKQMFPLRPAHIERFGGWERLREKGLANLSQVRLTDKTLIDTPEGGWFRVLTATVPLLAGRLMNLDRPVWWETPAEVSPLGILAVMPTPTTVAVHVVRDGRAPASITGLATFARLQARRCAEPISPHVYWAREEGLEQVTHWEVGSALQVAGGPEFTTLMADLATVGQIRPERPPEPRYAYDVDDEPPDYEGMDQTWGPEDDFPPVQPRWGHRWR